MTIADLKIKIEESRIIKDSLWAIFGNGIANGLLLIAGIFVARILGRDVYGEYGLVKSTMLYISGFATFGLGITSTKYIASFLQNNIGGLKSIIRDVQTITMVFSAVIALTLFFSARPLAVYLSAPQLIVPLRALGLIVMAKSVSTTQNGILAGFKMFHEIARNGMASGLFMLLFCVPLTYYGGLYGALLALFGSQVVNVIFNQVTIYGLKSKLSEGEERKSYLKELLTFSFPVALQESSYTICSWGGMLLLTKFSTVGEVGIYTASLQWNAVILMIPTLLGNVVLSYLSSTTGDKQQHSNIMKRMLMANVICTAVPLCVIIVMSGIITSWYGPSFYAMKRVLSVIVFSTVFECCSNVYRSEFIAQGKVVLLSVCRILRDICFLLGVYIILSSDIAGSGALQYAVVSVMASVGYLLVLAVIYSYSLRYTLRCIDRE